MSHLIKYVVICLWFISLPAFFHILCMAQSAELHSGGIHDDVTERHTDHVVVEDSADVDAVQVCQRHHQIIPAHRAAIGVLPVVLKHREADLLTRFSLKYFKLLAFYF